MKAQLSMEFLLDVVIVMFAIGIMATALHIVQDKVQKQQDYYEILLDVEEYARSLDALASSFSYGYLSMDAVYKVDSGRVIGKYGDEVILAGTLYGTETGKQKA